MSTTHYRTCNLCEALCGLEIQVEKNKATSIRGDKNDPFSRGHICPKAMALKDLHEDPNRLKFPVKRTENGWQRISWEEAIEETATRILDIQAKHGVNAVGVYQGNPSIHNLGTALFSPQFVRSLKTKNRFSATSVDQLAHHLAGVYMFGHSFLLPVPDIDRTDFWLILGGNPLVSNGSLMTSPDVGKRLRAIKERGGKVVVVDPRRTETADKASQHLFIRPGTDIWLLLAMIHLVFKENKVNLGHLAACLEASQIQEIKDFVADFPLDLAAQKTGIPREELQALTQAFCQANSAVCYGRLGVSTVEFGGLSHWALCVLNILTGNFDTPGGAMFTTPAFDLVRGPRPRPSFRRWHSRVRGLPEFGGELPAATLAEEILEPGEGQIRAMVTSCGNPVLSTPNGQQLDKALESLEFMVSIDIYINETTRHADIILPPASGLETAHYGVAFHNLAIRNTARYSEPTVEKEEGTKFDWEIILALQQAIQRDNLPEDEMQRQKQMMYYYANPEILLEMGFAKGPQELNMKRLKENVHGIDFGPLQSQLPERLMTSDKKINLLPDIYKEDLKRLMTKKENKDEGLLLIGRRHLRSNNSWLHNSYRMVKGRERCTLLIHPDDAAKRGLENGQVASVKSRVGEVLIPVEISDEMKQGVVSIPHGWGHGRKGVQLDVAQANAGVSANDLVDEMGVDALTGAAILNGVPVEVFPSNL